MASRLQARMIGREEDHDNSRATITNTAVDSKESIDKKESSKENSQILQKNINQDTISTSVKTPIIDETDDDILSTVKSSSRVTSAKRDMKSLEQQNVDLSKRTSSGGGNELSGIFNTESTESPNESMMESDSSEFPSNSNISNLKDSVNKEEISSENSEDSPINTDALEKIKKMHRKEVAGSIINKLLTALLVIACIYVIFLIFGVAVTDYGYNSNGVVEAQVLTVDDIKARNSYNVLKVQYEKLRVLYEEILQKDAMLGEGVVDYVTLGSEYAAIMDDAEDLGIKTDALVCDSKYTPTKELMYSWIADYTWTYLTAITQALTANDAAAADTAVVYKNQMYDGFSVITNNVIALGESIPGIDLDNIKIWSPDRYKQDFLNGMG